MTRAALGLGGNIGDRLGYLQAALDGLVADPAIAVVGVSHVYETDPVGGPDQDPFLNAVVLIDTALEPRELLERAQALERAARRLRIERWGPRTLDVDVLWIEGVRSEDPVLTLPHPRAAERGFVLVPLEDVAPEVLRDLGCDELQAERLAADQGVRRVGAVLQTPRR
jgi:2-amino-4-hydroxy-6-hydroxymethyldihydropteridine diphosphokinase